MDANITSQGFGNGDPHIRGDITVTPARKPNRIGLLTTRANVDLGAISVRQRSWAARISKMEQICTLPHFVAVLRTSIRTLEEVNK